MSFFAHAFHKYFIGFGPAKTTGHFSDLKAGEIGLFDAKTFVAIPHKDAKKSFHKEVIIGQGSLHSKDALTQFLGGLKEPVASRKINGNYISKFYLSKPKRAKNHVVAVGYNGVSECSPIDGVCDTTYTLRIEVKNSPVLRAYNRNLYRDIQIHTPCCGEDPLAAASDHWMADEFIKGINNDPELKNFVKAEKIFKPLLPYDSSIVQYNIYQVEVCDTGDIKALAYAQSQYPSNKVTRVARKGSISVYQIEKEGAAPSAFANDDIRVVPNCDTCPAGYTFQQKAYKFILRREEAATANGNTISDYGATSSVYLSHEDGVSTYMIYRATPLPANQALAVQGDVLINTGEVIDSVCFLDVSSTIAWAKTGEAYKTVRALCITVSKDCGQTTIPTTTTSTTTTTSSTTTTTTVAPNSVLGRLQAFYANDASIVPGSIILLTSGDCADVYQLKQYSSNLVQDNCDSKGEAVYGNVQAFENKVWEVCPCPSPSADSTDYKVGIRITAAYADTKFGNCSFQPEDFNEVEPIQILVSQVDRNGDVCATGKWGITELQAPQQAQGLGETLLRELQVFLGYKDLADRWDHDPRMREVKDNFSLEAIDRNKFYKVYTLIHHIPSWDQSRLRMNQESYALHFVFPEDAVTTDFEKIIGGYAASNDVVLESY